MYNKLKFLHRKTQSVFFFKFLMICLLSRHHPAANPSPPFPLWPAAGQRGRGGEGLAEAQLPHIFHDGVSPFAPAQDHNRSCYHPSVTPSIPSVPPLQALSLSLSPPVSQSVSSQHSPLSSAIFCLSWQWMASTPFTPAVSPVTALLSRSLVRTMWTAEPLGLVELI